MPNVRELLEREGETVDLERGDFERLLRRRDRRQRSRRIRAGALALVVMVVAAAFVLRESRSKPTPADRPVPPSPSEHLDQRPPIEGLEFPMLSEGARPSTPIRGDAVVTFRSWSHDSIAQLAIYADGRIIWHPSQNDVGFFQLRLTPAGVNAIRSRIISTGLFNHRLDLKRDGVLLSRLSIMRGHRSVFVQWGNASWWAGIKQPHEATPSESRDLGEIERLLGDPSAWQLSGNPYADPEIRPFVPSGFLFEYDRDGPDMSQLPSTARDLLARYDPGSTKCSIVTTEVARKIARALARAGFTPLTNDSTYLDWRLPGSSGGPSNPHLNPVLPHELNCDFSE